MQRYLWIILGLFLVAGCSSDPTTGNISNYAQTNSTDTARHIFTRDRSFVAIALKIKVYINGREVGRLRPGQTISVDVPAGPTLIVVEQVADTGNFIVNGDAKIGNTYKYTITANSKIWKSALCGICSGSGGSWKVIPEGY